jgi:membrane protease YdiL (CAAX protease family)
LWIALSSLRFFLTGQHFELRMNVFIACYAVILTPVFEEIMFRGYIQSSLAALKTPFLLTDLITTALFLVPHCIGWNFQGVLSANLTIGGISVIAILSLVLGFVRYTSKSLVGNVLLHVINNLVSIVVH